MKIPGSRREAVINAVTECGYNAVLSQSMPRRYSYSEPSSNIVEIPSWTHGLVCHDPVGGSTGSAYPSGQRHNLVCVTNTIPHHKMPEWHNSCILTLKLYSYIETEAAENKVLSSSCVGAHASVAFVSHCRMQVGLQNEPLAYALGLAVFQCKRLSLLSSLYLSKIGSCCRNTVMYLRRMS